MTHRLLLALLAAFALGSVSNDASAQVFTDDPNQQQQQQQPVQQQPVQQQPVQQQQPVYQDQPVQQQQYQQQPQQVQQPERGARQTSVNLHVPIFLSDAGDALTPGIGIHARFGWEFGMLVPEIRVGFQANFFKDVAGVASSSTLNSFFLSLGARLQFLNTSRFIPFVSGGVQLSWWGGQVGGVTTDYVVDPGLTFGGGLAIELTQSFGLEIGVDALLNFPVQEVFDGTQFVLAPRAGGTLYF